MADENDVLDLDAARASRSATQGKQIPLRFGGEIVCMLPAELPVDVLEPLTHLKVDTALIARTALNAVKDSDAAQAGLAVAAMVVDMVIGNPSLPSELLDAVRAMGRRLMGDAGYDRFVAMRPSIGDVAALVKGLAGRYSFRLGESRPSSPDSSDGEPSTPTSSTTSRDSTSPESGSGRAIEGSSPLADGSTSSTSSLPTHV